MSLSRRILNLFRPSQLQEDIDAELRAHLEMRAADSVRDGMSAGEAKRDAALRFGSTVHVSEEVLRADREWVLAALWRDLKYAMRQLRSSPGFACTAAATVALGISVNVIVFSLLNGMLLHNPDGIANGPLLNIVQKDGGSQSYPDYLDFKHYNSSFTDLATYRFRDVGIQVGGTAIATFDSEVSANYFDLLGATPELGHFFHASDDHGRNSIPYLVISYPFWRAYFNGRSDALGATVYVNKQPFRVLGVAKQAFHGTEHIIWPDFWLPIINEQQVDGYNFLDNRFNHSLFVAGRLKPGVTAEQATADLNAVAHQLAKQYPITNDGMGLRLVRAGMMGDELSAPASAFLAAIMFLALLVLAAACTNLASIFAARASDRTRELGIRLAIGSSRWNVMRQIIIEGLLLSLAGGLLGTAFALAVLRMLTDWRPIPGLPVHANIHADTTVFLVAIVISLLSGILPGFVPARQILRMDAIRAIRGLAPSDTVFRRFTVREALLAVQVSLCALLLMASLVALRGMQRSLHAPFGFDPADATLASTNMHMGGYSDQSSPAVQKRMIDAASHIPGVISAASINNTPLGTGGSNTRVYPEKTSDFRPTSSAGSAKYYSISPGYFEVAHTHLLSGRDFTWHDDRSTPKVAIVNLHFARMLFGAAPALGKQFSLVDHSTYEIVGLVENGKYGSLTEPPTAAMFFPVAQSPDTAVTFLVRSQLPPADLARSLNEVLTSIDPGLPFTIQTWNDNLALRLFPARAAAISLGVMGFLAAVLSVSGVFGISSYSVSRRKKEFGIRLALGSGPVQLLYSALSRPLLMVLCGSFVGLMVGIAATRLLGQIVYQASPNDPLVWCIVIAAMAFLGCCATWIPARRALRINPATLVKNEC